MEVQCENCGARLKVPEDRIPKGGLLQGGCPRCKAKITLPPKETSDYEPLPQELSYAGNVKLALVVDTRRDPGVMKSFEESGYSVVYADSSGEALFRLDQHHFEIVLIADDFEGRPLTSNPVMEYLNRSPMQARRRMLVIIVGEAFKTGDRMEAFSLSADLVLCRSDMKRFKDILSYALSEKERFYGSFIEIMAESGRV